ncbi:MAG: DUF167 domain-containing protein [Desulfurococcus sp.]|uniref:DUF167 domain-containing protein n=3 Tax=Desulfurococcus sp. TaxID=51678 RepID=UPI003168B54D
MSQLLDKIRGIVSKHISESSQGIILSIRVKPGDVEDYITIEGDELVFHTAEQSEKGRENAALVKYLARELKIPVSKIDIVYGRRETLKKVLLNDVDPDELAIKLAKLVRLV